MKPDTILTNAIAIGATKKVLIVDDSRVIRTWLRATLSTDRRLEIVGEARSAVEARDFLRTNTADVLTLDIEMPGMNGLDFLKRLMHARPMPVVMLSSWTAAGSDAAIQAMSRGAIDCILKPVGGQDSTVSREICDRVFQAACIDPMRLISWHNNLTYHQESAFDSNKARYRSRSFCPKSLVLLGASTGGVSALETVFPQLPVDGAPVVVVQHMPGNFLQSFAARLQRHLPQTVGLAEAGKTLHRGTIVLAPGNGKHTIVERDAGGWRCKFEDAAPGELHCPSVDRLYLSAVPHAENVTAAILTGLGKDGAQGLLQLSRFGATTFGQDKATSVVYGMPRAAHAVGAVQHQLPLEKIGAAVCRAQMQSAAGSAFEDEVPHR